MIALLLLLVVAPDPPGVSDPRAETAWAKADELRKAARAKEAVEAFEALARAFPSSRRAAQALAAAGTLARWELDDPARAKALWIRALEGPSELPGVDAALNELLALEREVGGVEAEIALSVRLAERRKGAEYAPRLWIRAAELRLEGGDLRRALALSRSAVAAAEGTTWWDDAAMLEGRCLAALSRGEEAIKAFRRVTASQRATLFGGDENSDHLDDAYLAIARALEGLGRLEDAERAYARLADEVPHSVWVDDALEAAARLAAARQDAAGAARHRARLTALRPSAPSKAPR